MNILELALEIAVIAIMYVILTVTIQRKLGNVKRIKEIKKEMNAKMADLKKQGENVNKEEFAARQKEITALAGESMRHQLKPTFIILPIFFLIFYVALPHIFVGTQPPISMLSFSLTYQQFFIAVAFVTGISFTILIGLYERIKDARAARSAVQAAQNQSPAQ